MLSYYKHGGGYKKAALNAEVKPEGVVDYSISINWKAKDFYPEELIYDHHNNMLYPDPEYIELKSIIEEYHNIPQKTFILTHGANEAIAALFNMLVLASNYKEKEIYLVGPTYSEYNKYIELYNLKYSCIHFTELESSFDKVKNNIAIIVNPNTPGGQYYNIRNLIIELLDHKTVIILDESFIDFTDRLSASDLISNYQELYIVHSLTKFYGSAGARLGLLISSNHLLNNLINYIIPPWTISAYDCWFYKNIIINYNKIKQETITWIKTENKRLKDILKHSENIIQIPGSLTNFHTFELTENFVKQNAIKNLKTYFLKEYNIHIRPVSDFYGYNENCFRAGLQLPEDNEPLFKALKAIR